MKIKKIEWREHIKDDGSSWFSSTLPFQYNVSVMATTDHQFHWGVCNFLCELVCGTAPTVEQAKDACQVAWEKMVMETLEDGGCAHCKDGKVIYDGKGLVLSLGDGALDVKYPQEYGGPCYDSVDINYCPMCGRKL